MKTVKIKTDVLIIGAGAAGSYAGIVLGEKSDKNVLVVDKSNIVRSGCLAAGVNALNAYINKGYTEDDYLEYVKREFKGVVREDLVYSVAKRLNSVTEKMESLGLPIMKDEDGEYVKRGKRSIKINGEYIKPLLYEALKKSDNIELLENTNVFDYIVKSGKVIGAYGFSVTDDIFYIIESKATLCTTGGAAGLYRPNNPGKSRHKMWYSPFNTGAGYAMGIRAGAEMTSFEMRFMALRCKDTIAPTGTIAQGVEVEHINARGENYISGKCSTADRLKLTIEENIEGRGPCYLKTEGIDKEKEMQLYKAYLNMAPAQTLKWFDEGKPPSSSNVEIEGTEPYITGGHSGAGYWVDSDRKTTLDALYAAGDVAGGSPKKYVTGCFAEAEIAVESMLRFLKDDKNTVEEIDESDSNDTRETLERYLENKSGNYSIEETEQSLQKIMDEYAGGISKNYSYSESRLKIALEKLESMETIVESLSAKDNHELMFIQEIKDRLIVAKVLIHHMIERKESRWVPYQHNLDYREEIEDFGKMYINSEYLDKKVVITSRNIVRKGERYEHKNR
jgi:adenylylsulfate reductase, subunit A